MHAVYKPHVVLDTVYSKPCTSLNAIKEFVLTYFKQEQKCKFNYRLFKPNFQRVNKAKITIESLYKTFLIANNKHNISVSQKEPRNCKLDFESVILKSDNFRHCLSCLEYVN